MATDQVPGTETRQPFPAGPSNRLAGICCRVVGHTGDWTYPDAQCVRVRMCKRCGQVISKQEHAWSAFGYLAAGRCEQERRCERCGAVESRVLHSWGPWLYGLDNYFQSHICDRCGAEEHFYAGVPGAGSRLLAGWTPELVGQNQARRATRGQEATWHAVDRVLQCAGDELMDRRLSARTGPTCTRRVGLPRQSPARRRSAAEPP